MPQVHRRCVVESPRWCLSLRAPPFRRWPALVPVTLGSRAPSCASIPYAGRPVRRSSATRCQLAQPSLPPPALFVEAPAKEDKVRTVAFTLGVYPKASETGSNTYLYADVHSSTISNGQGGHKPNAYQPVDRYNNRGHPFCRIVVSHTKERSAGTCRIVAEP